MTALWTCPNTGIEYGIVFTPTMAVDSLERNVPEVRDIENMIAETGDAVNLQDAMNLAWFRTHRESIYAACDLALANAEHLRGYDETL